MFVKFLYGYALEQKKQFIRFWYWSVFWSRARNIIFICLFAIREKIRKIALHYHYHYNADVILMSPISTLWFVSQFNCISLAEVCALMSALLVSNIMIIIFAVVTHAHGSRVSIVIIRACDSVGDSWFCDSLRTIKPKRLKLKLPNLAQR